MATIDTGKVFKDTLATLTEETDRVTAARANASNSDAAKGRAALQSTLKTAAAIGLDQDTIDTLSAKLDAVKVATGIDTTAGDLAASILGNLSGLPGAVTEKQREAIDTARDAWLKVAKRRGGKRGAAGSGKPQPYVLAPIAILDPSGKVFAVETNSVASIAHTTRKGVRMVLGMEPDASYPVSFKAATALLQREWGVKMGPDGEPSQAPAAVGASLTIPTEAGEFTWQRVEHVTRDHGGLKGLRERYPLKTEEARKTA